MEFAYSPSMQLILLLVSTAATVIINYITLNLALMLNGEIVAVKKKLLFVVIFSSIQQAVIYGLYLSGLLHIWFPGSAEVMIRLPNPLMAVLFYFMLVRVTGLSKYRCCMWEMKYISTAWRLACSQGLSEICSSFMAAGRTTI